MCHKSTSCWNSLCVSAAPEAPASRRKHQQHRGCWLGDGVRWSPEPLPLVGRSEISRLRTASAFHPLCSRVVGRVVNAVFIEIAERVSQRIAGAAAEPRSTGSQPTYGTTAPVANSNCDFVVLRCRTLCVRPSASCDACRRTAVVVFCVSAAR